MDSNRVLFLDFDGVLNSAPFLLSEGCTEGTYHPRLIDPAAVQRLNRVLAEGRASVVVSSSWRIVNTIGALYQILLSRGFVGTLIDRTPVLRADGRHRDIAAWLDQNATSVTSFAIVDDDHDAGIGYASRFVQTSFSVGLTDADADRLIAILCGGSEVVGR